MVEKVKFWVLFLGVSLYAAGFTELRLHDGEKTQIYPKSKVYIQYRHRVHNTLRQILGSRQCVPQTFLGREVMHQKPGCEWFDVAWR